MSGYFFSLEGGEGAGKTTVSVLVADRLRELGYEVLLTREPGGVPIAEQIREVVVSKENDDMDYVTEALLYAASRREHLVKKVLPALSKGQIVLCDRYVHSSLVYQGHVRGLGMDFVAGLNEYATNGMIPVRTFYMDLDPEIGIARVMKDDEREKNRFDVAKMEFHHKVREGFLELVEKEARVVKLDADREIDVIVEEMLAEIVRIVEV